MHSSKLLISTLLNVNTSEARQTRNMYGFNEFYIHIICIINKPLIMALFFLTTLQERFLYELHEHRFPLQIV
ncbi:uncharacterized protein SOCG_05265 [Schizosaccharomyces octosporus yFS286]|uniref:Uncharacterized protein n=1 Tax=Schizosaccharomyces octosporus (strain yFS286) TaxID=483514 RepID=S9R9J8_SCHOY|nr:uncharacterized protein SOCG_05265 [Schizosaccharomyces octosporus yFS286]EPX74845.1 hypothetical protein SOCG_05265 [Schizosaccharomyces octosporus yFS286]